MPRISKPEGEHYTPGYSVRMMQVIQQRSPATCAPYFLPYLQPGMAVLDCGCGAGSMTVEPAERVAPVTCWAWIWSLACLSRRAS